ncbi:hypothetical protein STEG23_020083, partial [Scotinomys teguina]
NSYLKPKPLSIKYRCFIAHKCVPSVSSDTFQDGRQLRMKPLPELQKRERMDTADYREAVVQSFQTLEPGVLFSESQHPILWT